MSMIRTVSMTLGIQVILPAKMTFSTSEGSIPTSLIAFLHGATILYEATDNRLELHASEKSVEVFRSREVGGYERKVALDLRGVWREG
jgi:hypothetical protein